MLHDSGYQGGSDLASQLVHYSRVCNEEREKLPENEREIELLRGEMMAPKEIGTNSSSSSSTSQAGNNRSFGLMN